MSRKKFSLIGVISDFEYHGEWGDYNSPKTIKAFLAKLDKNDVAEIEINSPGGLVIQGIEIANAIKNCPAKVIARVTGVAASMASVIACACDEIELEEASFMMFHDPWCFAYGNSREMRKQAVLLDQMKEVIMSFYRGKFPKMDHDALSEMMAAETWYTASECAENGMTCTVIPSDVRAAALVAGIKFANIPENAMKHLKNIELDEKAQSEIEKLRAKALATEEEEEETSTEETTEEEETEETTEEEETEETTEEETTETSEEETSEEEEEEEEETSEETPADSWEARYKGASRKINELNAKLAAASAAASALDNFNSQVKATGFKDLAALIASASSLKSDLEKRDQALADAREQLEHMKKTRNLLTGGVLSAGANVCKYDSFAKAVDALGYVEASAKYPELKKSYRK